MHVLASGEANTRNMKKFSVPNYPTFFKYSFSVLENSNISTLTLLRDLRNTNFSLSSLEILAIFTFICIYFIFFFFAGFHGSVRIKGGCEELSMFPQ